MWLNEFETSYQLHLPGKHQQDTCVTDNAYSTVKEGSVLLDTPLINEIEYRFVLCFFASCNGLGCVENRSLPYKHLVQCSFIGEAKSVGNSLALQISSVLGTRVILFHAKEFLKKDVCTAMRQEDIIQSLKISTSASYRVEMVADISLFTSCAFPV